MRKRLILMMTAWAACAVMHAQEVLVSTATDIDADVPTADSLSTDTYSAGIMRRYAPVEPAALAEPYWAVGDSLHLPLLTSDGRVMPIGRYPFYRYGWGGLGTWDLHKGLNVSLSASVFAQVGKHAHHRVGFAQSLSAMYATPLTPKLSLAVGGYMNQVMWSHAPMREAGLSAVLSYRFNEHWEAYLYGQKSLVASDNIPWALYDMGALGDRIGAAVRYHFNPSFSVEVSVEHGGKPKGDNFERTFMQRQR